MSELLDRPFSPEKIGYADANRRIFHDKEDQLGQTQMRSIGQLPEVSTFFNDISEANIARCRLAALEDELEWVDTEDSELQVLPTGEAFSREAGEGHTVLLSAARGLDSLLQTDRDALEPRHRWLVDQAESSEAWAADLDTDYADRSIEDWGAFLGDYSEKFEQLLQNTDLQETSELARQTLIEALASGEFKQATGISGEALQMLVEQTPVHIVDPLTMLGLNQKPEIAINGVFHPVRREAYIDATTIVQMAINRHPLESNRKRAIQASVMSTTIHELIHSLTNSLYVGYGSNDDDSEGRVDSRSIYPKFFKEGMTEKLTALALSIAYKNNPDLPGAGHRGEFARYDMHREDVFDVQSHVLAPKYTQELVKIKGSSSMPHRALIDMVFERADWEAAGITRGKAERMSAKAFVMPSVEDEETRNIHRKEFMHVLGLATHTGFFVKLGKIVDIFGPAAAADILESESLDIHDPLSIPNLPVFNPDDIAAVSQKVDYYRARRDDFARQDVPANLLEFEEKRLQGLELKLAGLTEQSLALDALYTGIGLLHGHRVREISPRHQTMKNLGLSRIQNFYNNKALTGEHLEAFRKVNEHHPSWGRYTAKIDEHYPEQQ